MSLRLVLSGAVSGSVERGASGKTAVETFRYRLPAGLPAGATVDIAVEARDDFGNLVTRTTRATVLADSEDPDVRLSFAQTVSSVYTAGSVVELIALAGDNVAIDRLTLIDGATLASTVDGAPIDYAYTLPAVAAPTYLTVEVEASDAAGNLARTSRQLQVLPLQNAGILTVLFDCLTQRRDPAGQLQPAAVAQGDRRSRGLPHRALPQQRKRALRHPHPGRRRHPVHPRSRARYCCRRPPAPSRKPCCGRSPGRRLRQQRPS